MGGWKKKSHSEVGTGKAGGLAGWLAGQSEGGELCAWVAGRISLFGFGFGFGFGCVCVCESMCVYV